MKRGRAPLDASGGRPTTAHELQLACGIVDRSGVVPVLEPYFTAEVGRHRLISLRGLLVAFQLNALARHHKAHLIEVARAINAMSDEQRERLGIVRHDPAQTYDRVDRTFTKLAAVLEAGHDGITARWFANRMAQASVPEEFRQSRSIAVDGTDVETWGALHGDAVTVELDGEATETQLMDDGLVPKPRKPARKAKVFGTGVDGRNVYTADADARAGHRSATNSRPAGPYVGYELHLAVQARDVKWTNYVDKVTMSDEVPGVITCFALEPAGTHRGRAIVDDLVAAKHSGAPIDDVVWDPGYSLCSPGTTHHKLARAGIHQTMQLVTHQRGARPFSGDALLVDGQLYSSLLPDALRDLPMWPRGASEAEKLEHEAKFNLRARWRMVRHAGPDADGATRWRCPFCAGMLRSRSFPKTMRRPKTVPLVPVDEGCDRCCSGILTAMPAELPWWQRIPFGTTAWRLSMGRRQVVESANAALKGTFADLARGFFRVFGQTKMTVLLGFTIAGYNLDRIRSFRAKQRALEADKPKQPKRRRGTWAEVIAPASTVDGTASPPD
ncbi:MAG TPA: hypothetical protein VKV34_00660 [Thermoleophilia bacterium]|nr:hypothetical protein [Thermoleophilia bacterium]